MLRLTRDLETKIPKKHWNGTHRSLPPDETVRRLAPFIKTFGITRVANVTGLDWLGIPVVMVCRPNSRSLSVSQGKGLTLDAARASGLMESIELFHAEHISLPLKIGSFREMSKYHKVVNPEELPGLDRLNYHAHAELLWVEGYDLLKERPTWVPYEYVSVNTSSQNRPGQGHYELSSNGLASGNNLLEAIVHGMLEVVERDAMTLWHRRKTHLRKASCIDLDSCEDSNCRKLIAQCRDAGLHIFAWEVTSDVGLPTFSCLLHEGHNNPLRLPYASEGMGCHLSATIALLRAITEAAQCRLTLITGSRDDLFRAQYQLNNLGSTYLPEHLALVPPKVTLRKFPNTSSIEFETFNEDIRLMLNRIHATGAKQVIVVPLTEAESPFQVVKVVIPGLEGYDAAPSYAPGKRAQQLRN